MAEDFLATSRIVIDASPETVWHAITDPDTIARYYFGTRVTTDWAVGSAISWEGEYNGTSYRDHGTIEAFDEPRMLRHTHFSPLSGAPDLPDNYHELTWRLEPDHDATIVTLVQSNNDSADSATHSQDNWDMVLEGLKKVVEQG